MILKIMLKKAQRKHILSLLIPFFTVKINDIFFLKKNNNCELIDVNDLVLKSKDIFLLKGFVLNSTEMPFNRSH